MRERRARLGGDAGFALVEVTLALALIALLAALALPGLVRATGTAALRATALEVSALLRDDRTAAIRTGRPVTTAIAAGAMRAGAGAAALVAPAGVLFHGPAAMRFLPDGRSSGGAVVVASDRARIVVDVSPDTGGIRVVAP